MFAYTVTKDDGFTTSTIITSMYRCQKKSYPISTRLDSYNIKSYASRNDLVLLLETLDQHYMNRFSRQTDYTRYQHYELSYKTDTFVCHWRPADE